MKDDKKCPHLNCLVYHKNGICNCDMKPYCPECNSPDTENESYNVRALNESITKKCPHGVKIADGWTFCAKCEPINPPTLDSSEDWEKPFSHLWAGLCAELGYMLDSTTMKAFIKRHIAKAELRMNKKCNEQAEKKINRLYDQIDDAISEFGDNPKDALAIIEEILQLQQATPEQRANYDKEL